MSEGPPSIERGWASRGWLPVAATVVILDQLTKWWAVNALDERSIDLVWTLRLHLAFNTGMAFSQGEGWGPVIGVIALVIIVVLLLGLRREQSRVTDVAVGLIVGGAIGNVIDRIFREPGWMRGAVVDFIDLQWFPIFNVADMAITVGGALLIGASWFASRRHAAGGVSSGPAADHRNADEIPTVGGHDNDEPGDEGRSTP